MGVIFWQWLRGTPFSWGKELQLPIGLLIARTRPEGTPGASVARSANKKGFLLPTVSLGVLIAKARTERDSRCLYFSWEC
jgi:hypothetical protein